MITSIELGEDIDKDFNSWYNCCISLGVTPNINKFLKYIHNYGTYQSPKGTAS